jgi:hypothetical protein
VLHREGDAIEPVGAGRYLGREIPGAEYVELPGADHFPWAGDQDALVAEVRRFVSTIRSEEQETFDRVPLVHRHCRLNAQAAALGDSRWLEVRREHDHLIRTQLARFRGREIKTMGDGFLAAFDGPARGVRCARAICESMGRRGLGLRAGLHTGEVEVEDDDVSGIAVTIGARVTDLAGPGEVLVSSTVKDLVVGSALSFEDRGVHNLKGVPDE